MHSLCPSSVLFTRNPFGFTFFLFFFFLHRYNMTALGVGSAFYFHSLRYIFSRHSGGKGSTQVAHEPMPAISVCAGEKQSFLFSIKSRVIFNEMDKDPENATSEIFIFVLCLVITSFRWSRPVCAFQRVRYK